jgi:hypothetical protein
MNTKNLVLVAVVAVGALYLLKRAQSSAPTAASRTANNVNLDQWKAAGAVGLVNALVGLVTPDSAKAAAQRAQVFQNYWTPAMGAADSAAAKSDIAAQFYLENPFAANNL